MAFANSVAHPYIVLAHAVTYGTVAQMNRSMGSRVREDDVALLLCRPFCDCLVSKNDAATIG